MHIKAFITQNGDDRGAFEAMRALAVLFGLMATDPPGDQNGFVIAGPIDREGAAGLINTLQQFRTDNVRRIGQAR